MPIDQLSAPHRTEFPLSGAVQRALALGLLIVLTAAGARMLPSVGRNDPVAPVTTEAARQEPTGGERLAEARPLSAPAPRVVYAGPRVSAFDASPPLAPELPGKQSAQPSFPLLTGSYENPATTVVSEPEPPPEPAPLRANAPPAAPEETGALSADRGVPPDAAGERDLVDLNRASLAQLNDLRGVGRIGRAIIRGRPYASSDDLVQKRVLRRSTYERVKDQITVR